MLADILHDPTARRVRESVFSWYGQQDPSASGYDRLRSFGAWAGSGEALLSEPAKLFAALEAVAVCDPFVFHTAQVHYGVCLAAALELADDPVGLKPLVEALDTMSCVGTVLITELGSGGSHLSVRTRADWWDGIGEFRLSTPDGSAAKFMPNVAAAGIPKLGLVYARVFCGGKDGGVFPFVVPIRGEGEPHEGITVRALPGDNAGDFAVVSFDGVRVERHQWLGDGATIEADGLHDPLGSPDRRLVRSLTVSANASAAAAHAAVAAAQASAVIALRYAAQRTTTGRLGRDLPVLSYRTQQHALFGALAKAYAATCLLRSVAQAPAITGSMAFAPWAAVHREMALTKATVVAIAEDVAAVCRRRSGAQGVLAVNRIVGYEALAAAYSSAAGDSHLTLLDTGRSLLSELGESTLDNGPPDRRIASILRRLPGVPSEDSLQAWNPMLEGALELAQAYAQRRIARAMHATLEHAGSDRPLVEALARIYLTDEFSPGVPLDDAFDLLLNNLDRVLDAFDIPVSRLGAPIASADYVAALAYG